MKNLYRRLRLGCQIGDVRIYFQPRDFWVGLYFDDTFLSVSVPDDRNQA